MPNDATQGSGKLRQARAHESARTQPQLHPEKNSTRTRPLQWSSCMLVIFSCSNVINDIILRRTARCPRGAIGACRLPLPRAPGATTAFHPRAPLTQRDRRFLPFDSTRTNANPPVFDAPPLLLAKTKGLASPQNPHQLPSRRQPLRRACRRSSLHDSDQQCRSH